MPATDLDRRLRAALGRGAEPEPTPVRLASLRSAVAARRARRRLTLGAASAVAALGASLAILVPGAGGPPRRLAVPPATAAGPTCVEIVTGSSPPACAGPVVAHGPAVASSAVGAFASAASTPYALAAGRPVVVSLPRLAGVTWRTVVVSEASGVGAPVVRTVRVRPAHDGRSTAALGRLAAGSYELSATAVRRCSDTKGCLSGPVGWSTDVLAG